MQARLSQTRSLLAAGYPLRRLMRKLHLNAKNYWQNWMNRVEHWLQQLTSEYS
jgi:hypothetical protein